MKKKTSLVVSLEDIKLFLVEKNLIIETAEVQSISLSKDKNELMVVLFEQDLKLTNPNPFLKMRVKDMKISPRLFNTIRSNLNENSFDRETTEKITGAELLKFSRSDWMRMRNTGKKTVLELDALFAAHNLPPMK